MTVQVNGYVPDNFQNPQVGMVLQATVLELQ